MFFCKDNNYLLNKKMIGFINTANGFLLVKTKSKYRVFNSHTLSMLLLWGRD